MTPNYATLAAAQAAQAAATNAALAIARQQQQTQHQPTGGHAPEPAWAPEVLEGGVMHRVLVLFLQSLVLRPLQAAKQQTAEVDFVTAGNSTYWQGTNVSAGHQIGSLPLQQQQLAGSSLQGQLGVGLNDSGRFPSQVRIEPARPLRE